MNTPWWILAIFVAAGIAQIVAAVLTAKQWRVWWIIGFVALVLVLCVGFYPSEQYFGKRNLEDQLITLNPGKFDVDAFLKAMSKGEYHVVMEPSMVKELSGRHIKIETSSYQDMPFPSVLERVLIPQLPGPQQWEYEITGKTILIKRR